MPHLPQPDKTGAVVRLGHSQQRRTPPGQKHRSPGISSDGHRALGPPRNEWLELELEQRKRGMIPLSVPATVKVSPVVAAIMTAPKSEAEG